MCKFEALKQFEPYADLDYIDFSSHLFVAKIDIEKYDLNTANHIYESIQRCLPEGSVLIGLPKDVELQSWNLEELDATIAHLESLKEKIK